MTDKLLQAVFCVRSQGCAVREQHLADEHICDFSFRTQAGNVEELAVSPGVDIDSLAAVLDGVLEEQVPGGILSSAVARTGCYG